MAADFLKAALKKGIGIGAGGDIGFGAGPATSRTGGLSFGNFASGGGRFNPFASATGQLFTPVTAIVIGVVMVVLAFVLSGRTKKRGRR